MWYDITPENIVSALVAFVIASAVLATIYWVRKED
jgi:hypothetical protein